MNDTLTLVLTEEKLLSNIVYLIDDYEKNSLNKNNQKISLLHWNIGKVIQEIISGSEEYNYEEKIVNKLSSLLDSKYNGNGSIYLLIRSINFYKCNTNYELAFQLSERKNLLHNQRWMLPYESQKYFSSLDKYISSLPDEVRKRIQGDLNSTRINQAISAYFELSILDICNLPEIKSILSNAAPDITIIIDTSLCYIECTVCNWYLGKYKHYIKAVDIINRLYEKLEKNIKKTDTYSGIKTTIISYKGADLNCQEQNEIYDALMNFYENQFYNHFISDKIELFFQLDKINNRLFGVSRKWYVNESIRIFMDCLKKKKKDINKRLFNNSNSCIIALCTWGYEGASLYEINNQGGVNIIPELQSEIKIFFERYPKISGVFLFPNNWFPISGIKFQNGKEFLEITKFKNFIDDSPQLWFNFLDWHKDKQYFVFIKNLKSNSPIPEIFENKLSEKSQMYVFEI